jgi:NADH dehydrogenase FAD-containing subunit
VYFSQLSTVFVKITKFLREFDIQETQPCSFADKFTNLTVLQKNVSDLNEEDHRITCSDGSAFEYEKLCICTGSSPKLISDQSAFVLGIRDTETVRDFQARLANARQIVVVGNGGIATELVHEIENCKVVWAIKDSCIGHVYFDNHSARFFDSRINEAKQSHGQSDVIAKRKRFTLTIEC